MSGESELRGGTTEACAHDRKLRGARHPSIDDSDCVVTVHRRSVAILLRRDVAEQGQFPVRDPVVVVTSGLRWWQQLEAEVVQHGLRARGNQARGSSGLAMNGASACFVHFLCMSLSDIGQASTSELPKMTPGRRGSHCHTHTHSETHCEAKGRLALCLGEPTPNMVIKPCNALHAGA